MLISKACSVLYSNKTCTELLQYIAQTSCTCQQKPQTQDTLPAIYHQFYSARLSAFTGPDSALFISGIRMMVCSFLLPS